MDVDEPLMKEWIIRSGKPGEDSFSQIATSIGRQSTSPDRNLHQNHLTTLNRLNASTIQVKSRSKHRESELSQKVKQSIHNRRNSNLDQKPGSSIIKIKPTEPGMSLLEKSALVKSYQNLQLTATDHTALAQSNPY